MLRIFYLSILSVPSTNCKSQFLKRSPEVSRARARRKTTNQRSSAFITPTRVTANRFIKLNWLY